MATEAAVRAALQQLVDYYAPRDMKPERLAVYAAQLQQLDGGVLADAVKRCLTNMTWFPKLNELFTIANELPVKAKANSGFRERAFELERQWWHESVFIPEEWRKLADSMARAHLLTSSERILERMEAIQ